MLPPEPEVSQRSLARWQMSARCFFRSRTSIGVRSIGNPPPVLNLAPANLGDSAPRLACARLHGAPFTLVRSRSDAVTNVDLGAAVRRGTFRDDVFHAAAYKRLDGGRSTGLPPTHPTVFRPLRRLSALRSAREVLGPATRWSRPARAARLLPTLAGSSVRADAGTPEPGARGSHADNRF